MPSSPESEQGRSATVSVLEAPPARYSQETGHFKALVPSKPGFMSAGDRGRPDDSVSISRDSQSKIERRESPEGLESLLSPYFQGVTTWPSVLQRASFVRDAGCRAPASSADLRRSLSCICGVTSADGRRFLPNNLNLISGAQVSACAPLPLTSPASPAPASPP